MSRVICPNCGSEVVLPEHSSVTCGVTIAKDTDNKDYYLNMKTTEYGTKNNAEKKEIKNMGKVTERLNALKNAGFDTSKYFSVLSPYGEEVAMKWVNGVPTPCDSDELECEFDPIEEEIYANGYVKNTKLHRRFVMAQMFQALNSRGGFTQWLKNHGYDYQWKMVTEECKVLSHIENKDSEAMYEREIFFTKRDILIMLDDYVISLEKYIKKLPVHKCKGTPYYKIPRFGNVFAEDVDKKIISRIKQFIYNFEDCKTYAEMYRKLSFFRKYVYIKLPYDTKMSYTFVEAYKGAGAFYTLKNMILFHNVSVPEYLGSEVYSGREAMNYLNKVTSEYMRYNDGYKLLALLKSTIEYNHFDFNQRLKELGVIR